MSKVYGLLALLTLCSFTTQAQSTERLKVMTYNLLNYRNSTSYCTGTNNSASQKDSYLNTIVSHANPHILVCQEVGAQSGVPADRILTNALNTSGVNYWEKALYSNNGFSSIVNAVFYDTRFVELHSQTQISKDANNNDLVRVIDFYRFYYKDALLGGLDTDTVFFTVVAAHLKAGSTTSDNNQRSSATAAIMDYIENSVVDENIILCGDLNLNAGTSTAFQNMISYSVASDRLYDPLNETGTWYNVYGARYFHTQSTRTSNTNNGCFSGGGLDDRYDHILVSDEILNGNKGIEMVTNSFTILGNDGEHFNMDILDGVNLSVPSNVLSALHGMSDHLPVTLEFDIEKMSVSVEENTLTSEHIRVGQLNESDVLVEWPYNVTDVQTLTILDLHGRTIASFNPIENRQLVSMHAEASGIYLARITRTNGETVFAKFLKR